jgi:hypothetical protein
MGQNGFGPKEVQVKPTVRTRQRGSFEVKNVGFEGEIWSINREFLRSINSNSLEGIKVAKLFYKLFSENSKYSA